MEPQADGSPTVERSYRIHGRVQGVGFRWWTRSQALRFGVSGTVRNCPDGTVEVQVRGPIAAVEAMRRQLRKGPPGAWVEGVEETPAHSVPDHGFTIKR